MEVWCYVAATRSGPTCRAACLQLSVTRGQPAWRAGSSHKACGSLWRLTLWEQPQLIIFTCSSERFLILKHTQHIWAALQKQQHWFFIWSYCLFPDLSSCCDSFINKEWVNISFDCINRQNTPTVPILLINVTKINVTATQGLIYLYAIICSDCWYLTCLISGKGDSLWRGVGRMCEWEILWRWLAMRSSLQTSCSCIQETPTMCVT